jgi:hypothetical protein
MYSIPCCCIRVVVITWINAESLGPGCVLRERTVYYGPVKTKVAPCTAVEAESSSELICNRFQVAELSLLGEHQYLDCITIICRLADPALLTAPTWPVVGRLSADPPSCATAPSHPGPIPTHTNEKYFASILLTHHVEILPTFF